MAFTFVWLISSIIFFSALSFLVGFILGHRVGTRYGMQKAAGVFMSSMIDGLKTGYRNHIDKVEPGEEIRAGEPIYRDKDGKIYSATRIRKVN